MAAGNPLSDGLGQEIFSVDGVTDVLVTRLSLHAKFGTSTSPEAGMCDMLTDANRLDVEAALVSGTLPADAHSVILGTNYQKRHPEIGAFDYSWSIVNDPQRAERVESALPALLAGLPMAVVVWREVSRQSFAGEIVPYQFPSLEMGLFFLVLFGLEFLLSAWTAGRQRKQSLMEQMRAVE